MGGNTADSANANLDYPPRMSITFTTFIFSRKQVALGQAIAGKVCFGDMVKLGFGEIQFDYIRFPEPYKSLPPQVFPNRGDVSKPALLAEFLALAKRRLGALGVRSTADIFGLVTTVVMVHLFHM